MSNFQNLIGSGFGAAATASDAVDGIGLSGKTAIVTGGYSGIGVETVRALRSAGSERHRPGARSRKSGDRAEAIRRCRDRVYGPTRPGLYRFFCREVSCLGPPLHILVNTAGIMACPLARDSRGYKSQFTTTHLGHFQLSWRGFGLGSG